MLRRAVLTLMDVSCIMEKTTEKGAAMMDELELLKKRVEELETLVRGLLGDGRAISLTGVPIGDLVLGSGCQVTMHGCPTGTVFYGDQNLLEEAETRLDELTAQAEELENMIDDLEDRLDDLRDNLNNDQ